MSCYFPIRMLRGRLLPSLGLILIHQVAGVDLRRGRALLLRFQGEVKPGGGLVLLLQPLDSLMDPPPVLRQGDPDSVQVRVSDLLADLQVVVAVIHEGLGVLRQLQGLQPLVDDIGAHGQSKPGAEFGRSRNFPRARGHARAPAPRKPRAAKARRRHSSAQPHTWVKREREARAAGSATGIAGGASGALALTASSPPPSEREAPGPSAAGTSAAIYPLRPARPHLSPPPQVLPSARLLPPLLCHGRSISLRDARPDCNPEEGGGGGLSPALARPPGRLLARPPRCLRSGRVPLLSLCHTPALPSAASPPPRFRSTQEPPAALPTDSLREAPAAAAAPPFGPRGAGGMQVAVPARQAERAHSTVPPPPAFLAPSDPTFLPQRASGKGFLLGGRGGEEGGERLRGGGGLGRSAANGVVGYFSGSAGGPKRRGDPPYCCHSLFNYFPSRGTNKCAGGLILGVGGGTRLSVGASSPCAQPGRSRLRGGGRLLPLRPDPAAPFRGPRDAHAPLSLRLFRLLTFLLLAWFRSPLKFCALERANIKTPTTTQTLRVATWLLPSREAGGREVARPAAAGRNLPEDAAPCRLGVVVVGRGHLCTGVPMLSPLPLAK